MSLKNSTSLLISFLIACLAGCNPAGQTKIADSFMPGINEVRFLTIVSGNNQTAPHHQVLPLPLVVLVKDDQDKEVENAKVLWTITAGNGTVSSASSYTNDSGKASTLLTLGPIGVHSVTATVEGATVSISFTANATVAAMSGNWHFTSSSNYDFDPTKMEFAAGVCSLSDVDQLDDENDVSGFGGGSFNSVSWDETNGFIRLNSATNTSELDSSWAPKWSNLVGYWRLNGTGAIAHGSIISSSLGSAGNASNTNGSGMSYAAGLLNQGVNLDGVDDYILGPKTDALRNLTKMTVSSWIKMDSSGDGGRPASYDGNSWGAWLTAISSTSVSCLVSNGSAWFTASAALAISKNVWHHLLCVWNGSTISTYLNGQLVASVPAVMTMHGTDAEDRFRIGRSGWDGGPSYFKGIIDEVAVWNNALTVNEISNLYARQSKKYSGTFTSRIMDSGTAGADWTTLSVTTPQPVLDAAILADIQALWHLDETSATAGISNDFMDSSGNAHHAEQAGNITFGGNGRFNRAPRFDGVDDELTIANPVASYGPQLTLSYWMNPESIGSTSVALEPKWSNSAALRPLITGVCNTGKVMIAFTDSSGNINAFTSTSILTAANWYHVLLIYDSSQAIAQDRVKMYINGVLESRSTSAGCVSNNVSNIPQYANLLSSALDWHIGARESHTGARSLHFKGLIDEVAIWSRALAINEVQQLYRLGADTLKLQVRSCSSTDCSDSPWKGPDGTNQSYFTQSNNILSSLTGRYFQYRALLESDDLSNGLGVKEVSVGPDHFDSSSPAVVTKNGIPFHNLTALNETLGESCTAGIVYNLSLDKTSWYWWNGTQWNLANGTVAEANSAAVVNTNIAAFASQVGRGSLYVKSFLKSDGRSQCELNNVQLNLEN